ncbi:MAG TPA: carbohydrate porin, partial [Lamprocystis sp. (in: g-proteobacteria)]|nr:carbohydrate porin [Lamprocystis sp. (in: g-proteobacteria)]
VSRLALSVALVATGSALARDINDQLAINGLLAGAYQCQQVAGLPETDNVCRGALPFQPELFYKPTAQDQFFVKLGFAAGNGLDQDSPFALAPWAADLADGVKHINGRDRSYLLEAWYAHTFKFAADNSLQVTGGIIDPAFYINENAYANNEFTQFMNEAFVNSRNAFLPAYDGGGVLVWKVRDWTFSGVGMNLGENDDGNNYNYYAAEADYHLETALGEGNYRIMYSGTSRAFLDPEGKALEKKEGWVLSFDQAFGSVVGVFVRLGWQGDDALIDVQTEYSGGFDFKGSAWGREADNIGIAFGYLEGPGWRPAVQTVIVEPTDPQVVDGAVEAPAEARQVLARTNVFEAYYRFAFNDYLALSADVQYLKDKYRLGDDVDGWVFGLRAVAEF